MITAALRRFVLTPLSVQYHRRRAIDWFVGRARTPAERRTRQTLVQRFRRIHAQIHCAHSERELLLMADELLTTPVKGCLVELGCYKGGSTAKLSLVAQVTGRTLVVCDSFEGLPEPDSRDQVHHHMRGEELRYTKGLYSGTLDEVRANIRQYGVFEACQFVKGYFSDTLPTLQVDPCFVFMDVDLIASARDGLRCLWPRLRPMGRFYTHEVSIADFLQGIMDPRWWHETLGQCPPMLIGSGYGCGIGAECLGYFEKTPALVPSVRQEAVVP